MKQRIQLSDNFTYGRLIRFTLPSIGMMIFTSIYGVVDGFFVSNFAGKTPFAAINLIMPFLMILSTVGFMFGTGGSAIVAKTFGEGDSEKGNRYFSLFVYVSAALGVLFAVLGIIFVRPVARLLGAQGDMLEHAVLYARIILIALPFYILQLLFQSFLVTAEKPKLGLTVTVLSGLTNMVLDAVLVMLLPQEYKLAGAAVATAMSQVVGGGIPLIYFRRKNSSILRLGKCRFDGKAVFKACTNGSSEFMSNISMSLVGMLYNIQLLKYAGENGVAAYGVMMYVSMIFAAAFVGYSIGTAPIIGYHDGAGNHEELKGLLKKSLIMIGAFGAVTVVSGELLAMPLARLFTGYDPALTELTVSGFCVFALSFICMGYAIYGSSFFTALNDGVTSAIISFLRTLVFQIAAVMLLPLVWGIDGVWVSIVVTEFMAMALSDAQQIYKELGIFDKAEQCKKEYEGIATALENFWDEERGLYASYITENGFLNYAELTQYLIICSGAVGKERAIKISDLCVKKEGNLVPVTLGSSLFEFQALMRFKERYKDFLESEIEEKWGGMLLKGATSFWETLDGADAFGYAGSLCHGWSAAPVWYFNSSGEK